MFCSREKVKGISEVASGTPYSKKMAFKQGQESPNPRIETRKGRLVEFSWTP